MIVETVSELERMLFGLESKMVIAIPLWADIRAHPAMNTPCVLYLYANDQDIIVSLNHNEGLFDENKQFDFPKISQIYVPSKKDFCYFNKYIDPTAKVYDVNGMEYLKTGSVTSEEKFWIPLQKEFYTKFIQYKNINKSIPIFKLFEFFIPYRTHLQEISKSYPNEISYEFFNMNVIPTLWQIEKNGLKVNKEKYIEHFGERSEKNIDKNNFVYTSYNPYTTTGRPSNRWGGVNYSALNKSDGSREAFISRETQLLTLIDFESFHLRLIADILSFDLPTDKAVHEYLAEQYYGTTEITKELYDASKQKTFSLLYGENRIENAPQFIQKIWEYTDNLWNFINLRGWVNVPRGPYMAPGRAITLDQINEPTPAKIFNYLVQAREMEVGIVLISELFRNDIQPVMYTYDSILLDNSTYDELHMSIRILENHAGKYPVRLYQGKNYNEMEQIDKRVFYSNAN